MGKNDYGYAASLVFGNRDDNETEIVKAFRKCGVLVFKMPRSTGFDCLVIGSQIGIVCVEIKNPAQPPSKRTLTDHELEVKELVESRGARYVIIEDLDDVARLLEIPSQQRF